MQIQLERLAHMLVSHQLLLEQMQDMHLEDREPTPATCPSPLSRLGALLDSLKDFPALLETRHPAWEMASSRHRIHRLNLERHSKLAHQRVRQTLTRQRRASIHTLPLRRGQ